MTKTLLERVEELARSQAYAGSQTRAFILSNRAEIQKALDYGHPVKTVWQVLRIEGRVDCNYPYFWKLIRKYVTPGAVRAGAKPKLSGKPDDPHAGVGDKPTKSIVQQHLAPRAEIKADEKSEGLMFKRLTEEELY